MQPDKISQWLLCLPDEESHLKSQKRERQNDSSPASSAAIEDQTQTPAKKRPKTAIATATALADTDDVERTPRQGDPFQLPTLSRRSTVSILQAGDRWFRIVHFDWPAPMAAFREMFDQLKKIAEWGPKLPKMEEEAIKAFTNGERFTKEEQENLFEIGKILPEGLPGQYPAPKTVERLLRCSSVWLSYDDDDEAVWNERVHSCLLQAIFEEFDGSPLSPLDYVNVTTVTPISEFIPPPHLAHRVNYCLYLHPSKLSAIDGEETIEELIEERLYLDTCEINHVECHWLRRTPICFGITAKSHNGDAIKAEQEVGVWMAAQWRFLEHQCEHPDSLSHLPFIPGLIVIGNAWSVVYTTRESNGRVVCWSSQHIGTTSTPLGIYRIAAAVRVLAGWCLDVYWPWYLKYVLIDGREDEY